AGYATNAAVAAAAPSAALLENFLTIQDSHPQIHGNPIAGWRDPRFVNIRGHGPPGPALARVEQPPLAGRDDSPGESGDREQRDPVEVAWARGKAEIG